MREGRYGGDEVAADKSKALLPDCLKGLNRPNHYTRPGDLLSIRSRLTGPLRATGGALFCRSLVRVARYAALRTSNPLR